MDSLKPDLTLTQALRRLLEPMPPSDRQTLAEFEALLRRQAPTVSLAMGVKNGHFHYWWVRGANGAGVAASLARNRCQERYGPPCHVVLVGGALQPDGFAAAARALGTQPPEAVRTALLRAFTQSIVNDRQAQAASAPNAASAPPRAASATQVRPDSTGGPPPSGWAAARAKLRGPGAPQDLAGALAVLLQAETPADLAVLARLQAHTKRQRWNSAVAMGVLDGRITWRSVSQEQRADWAREKALSLCSAGGGVGCLVVAANGEPQLDAVRALADRLGARPQAEVRQQLLKTVDRHVP